MPIPKPGTNENQDKFMSRCISFMHDENAKKPDGKKWKNDQMIAICMKQWRDKDKQANIEEETNDRQEQTN